MRRTPTPFGRAVRIRLAQLNLQQRDLARMIGTSEAFITYLIYGDRRDEAWVLWICKALDMRLPALDDPDAEGVEFTAQM